MSSAFFPFLITFITLCGLCESARLKCPERNFTFINPAGKRIKGYCKSNNCIAKCCPAGQIYNNKKQCHKDDRTFDYSQFTIYKNDVKTKIQVSERNLTLGYTFIYDPKFQNSNCSQHFKANSANMHLYIQEDGSVQIEFPSYVQRWNDGARKYDYCVEIFINKNNVTKYVYKFLDEDLSNESTGNAQTVIIIGMIISAVFLFLTIVVYCLLPDLRNINGMIHMAYVGSLMFTFILKATLEKSCYYIGPLYYFFLISNFLWLATMSFNIWWTFRGSILHRPINRRGEMCKFLVYFFCVYGTSGTLTTIATAIDRSIVQNPHIIKPHFDTCFTAVNETMLYIYIPIGILILINCWLFGMTLYNIWIVKKGLQKFDNKETRRNQVAVCSFKVYVKLAMMMGVSWIIELAQMKWTLPEWPYIIVNLINSLIGVIIFVLLITEKKTIRKLCQRFNIQHKWVQESQKPSTTHSGYTGSQKTSKMETVELDKVDETTDTDVVN